MIPLLLYLRGQTAEGLVEELRHVQLGQVWKSYRPGSAHPSLAQRDRGDSVLEPPFVVGGKQRRHVDSACRRSGALCHGIQDLREDLAVLWRDQANGEL